MHVLAFVLSAPFIELTALFLSVVWMVRNPNDKVRPLLVIALTVNLFYGILLSILMGAEGSLLPWKYDAILLRMDQALGVSTASLAAVLQGAWHVPLATVYQLMVPMMICWFLVTRRAGLGGPLILTYVAELVTGPLLYAIVPGCGPAYALGPDWLHAAPPQPVVMRLAGMPNAFPSLHVATALVLVLFAPGKWSRAVAVSFFTATVMATISTGEHYLIDLVPGLAFACYAADIGLRRFRSAVPHLVIALLWCITVRFYFEWLIGHPAALRALALLTVIAAIVTVVRHWTLHQRRTVEATRESIEIPCTAPDQPPPVHMARP